MLAIFRIIITLIFSILISLIGCFYCLIQPKNPKNTMKFGKLFGKLSYIFGLKIIQRIPKEAKKYGPSIYISNHQNNYDMITISNVIQKNTITVGKKNLIFIPFFGQLYWLSGNILIDRKNSNKSYNKIIKIIKHIKNKKTSVWIFPEGTRNKKKGLLPFKNGAFYAAISAKVPIIPICSSETHGKIKLNNWNNGIVIIEMLKPIDTKKYNLKNSSKLAKYCYVLIQKKIKQLNQEVIKIEKNQKKIKN